MAGMNRARAAPFRPGARRGAGRAGAPGPAPAALGAASNRARAIVNVSQQGGDRAA